MADSLLRALLPVHETRATIPPGFLAYLANLDCVAGVAPEVARSIVQELADQRGNIKLIASENYSSLATQSAMANLLTDKYAEGIPHHRFYAGCDNVDSIEDLANKRACELFGASHAYAQPHSGADANLVAFWAILRQRVELADDGRDPGRREPRSTGRRRLVQAHARTVERGPPALGNQRLLGLDLASGGHLTHGYRLNASGKMFESHGYTVDRETFLLDYDAIERQAIEVKPLILLAGFSAYSRNINYARMREIADKVGAVLMVDMAHFAGLVAGKVLRANSTRSRHAHIVTTTTHKTLRGPRGGLVLDDARVQATHVDRGCPLVLGGPLPHVMAAKAVAFTEALRPEFATYAQQIVDNARALAEAFVARGAQGLTGGTDNHLLVVDVASDARDHRPPGRRGRPALRDHAQPQPDPLRPQRPLVHQRPAVRHRRPSPRSAWAGPRWTRSPRSSRWCSRTSSPARPNREHAIERSSPSTMASATRPAAASMPCSLRSRSTPRSTWRSCKRALASHRHDDDGIGPRTTQTRRHGPIPHFIQNDHSRGLSGQVHVFEPWRPLPDWLTRSQASRVACLALSQVSRELALADSQLLLMSDSASSQVRSPCCARDSQPWR